jgi:DNA-binding CsgD family transcriptional regulator
MLKFKLLFFFNLFIINCFSANTTYFTKTYFSSDSTKISNDETLKKLFETGTKAYGNYEYNKAIDIWKTVLKKADRKKDSVIIVKSSVNIGSGYSALGYHKTALNYFLKSNKILEDYKNENESYWVNHINIGVCYMSLEQYELAKQYFDKTKDFSPYVGFVKKLNLAKWNGLQDNKAEFYTLQEQVSNLVNQFPMFLPIWEELQLDFLIKWNDQSQLLAFINQNLPEYNQKNLFLKIQYNQALLLLNKAPAESISDLLKYEKQVVNSNDFFLKDIYYDFLKAMYFQKKDLNNFNKYVLLAEKNNEEQSKERNMLYVEDFKEAQAIEILKEEVTKIQLQNQLIQSKLTKSNLMFRFSILIIVMGLGIIFLLIRNYRKNKKIQSLQILKTQNELLKKEFEKYELTENLKETADELVSSILNIKKVALLKKELENIVDEKNSNYNEKETLKKIKLCLNSFFDNYRELTQMMQKKLNVDKIVDFVKKSYPEISEKEIRVIEYITLHFTTKEIALLMGKSEKSVEYYRSQIRKKIQLDKNESLEDFFISKIFT